MLTVASLEQPRMKHLLSTCFFIHILCRSIEGKLPYHLQGNQILVRFEPGKQLWLPAWRARVHHTGSRRSSNRINLARLELLVRTQHGCHSIMRLAVLRGSGQTWGAPKHGQQLAPSTVGAKGKQTWPSHQVGGTAVHTHMGEDKDAGQNPESALRDCRHTAHFLKCHLQKD